MITERCGKIELEFRQRGRASRLYSIHLLRKEKPAGRGITETTGYEIVVLYGWFDYSLDKEVRHFRRRRVGELKTTLLLAYAVLTKMLEKGYILMAEPTIDFSMILDDCGKIKGGSREWFEGVRRK